MGLRSNRRYGKKDGTSANAGRKAAIYLVTTPDGVLHKKRSFQINAPIAFCGAYEHQNKWYVSGIVAEPQNWPRQIFVEAVLDASEIAGDNHLTHRK